MPVRRRMTNRSSARRTNWIGTIQTAAMTSCGTNANNTTEPFSANWSAEVFSYVSPTLIRLRGSIDFITNAVYTAGTHIVRCAAALWVGPQSDTLDPSQADAFWSSDRIIWTGSWINREVVDQVGTDRSGSMNVLAGSLPVDVKAMRKLGDDQRIFLTVFNTVSSNETVSYANYLRALIKE